MPKIVDYYLSLNSPWTYLGGPRLEEILLRHGAEVRVKPINLGAVFPRTGGLPLPKRAPARQAYRMAELKRWRDHLDMAVTLQPKFFPAPDRLAAGMVLAAGESGGDPLRLAHAVLRAVWAEERNIADEPTLLAIAEETGQNGPALMERSKEETMTALYERVTEAAVERGVFGAPSYITDGELFWGQDRLDFLDRALAG